MSTGEFPTTQPMETDEVENNIAIDIANDLIEDTEMGEEKTSSLQNFSIRGLLQLIEDAINNEEYEIEILIDRIYEF